MITLIEVALWYLWLCCFCAGLVASLMIWEVRAERKTFQGKVDAESGDTDGEVVPPSPLDGTDARSPRFPNRFEAVKDLKAG